MVKINEYIVCHKQVCKVLDIVDNILILEPVDDPTLKMRIPMDSPFLKPLITKQEIDYLLKKIPSIEVLDDTKMMENLYKELLHRGTYEDLVKIIKTAYCRNERRKNNRKKISDRDNSYLLQAEKYLYTEIGVVLGLNFEQTKEYVINIVSKYFNE